MTPDDVIAAYAAALTDSISVTRPGTVPVTATARCRIQNYNANSLSGTIMQGDQMVIVLKSDLDAAGFPVPIKNSDKMVSGGRTMIVQSVDANTRRIDSTVIAYVCQARGS